MSLEHASLPRLRRGLSHGLDMTVEALEDEAAARVVLAQPPLCLPVGVEVRGLGVGALPEPDPSDQYPLGQRWPELSMHSISFPYMACVLEGEIDLRVGFPAAMMAGAMGQGDDAGDGSSAADDTDSQADSTTVGGESCHVLSLPVGSFLLIPPGVAYANGALLPWERPQPELARARAEMLWIHFLPSGAMCHLSSMHGESYTGEFALHIEDAHIMALWNVLTNELERRAPDEDVIAQSLLRTLLMRLRRGLAEPSTKVADGIYFWLPAAETTPSVPLPGLEVLEKACEYIQFNLHEALVPADIARHVQRTPTQLNRIFRRRFGMTTMDYVTQQRLAAAKIYLSNHQMSIAEVSQLIGYPQPAHFSRVFKRNTGLSPFQFRRNHRE